MVDVLYTIDVAVFHFINGTLANPVFDAIMPVLSDLNLTLYGRIAASVLWFLLVWKGGKRGRIAALLLIPLIVFSDQLSSSIIKKLVCRPRPCHMIDSVPMVTGIRLLVDCGGGFSFPSSHAVNNFAAATLFSYFYRKWIWAFAAFAGLVSLSRVSVGVHYPSDILGGAVIGVLCAVIILLVWVSLAKRFPVIGIEKSEIDRQTDSHDTGSLP
jgi:undecaprenyl-diphosphatase